MNAACSYDDYVYRYVYVFTNVKDCYCIYLSMATEPRIVYASCGKHQVLL